MKVVHFVSTKKGRVACGAYYPPIGEDPERRAEDPILATCGRCQNSIAKAIKTGEMIFQD